MTEDEERADEAEPSALPTIPGLTFRRCQGLDDLPEIARVMNLSREADGVDHVTTAADLTAVYSMPLDFDPKADVVMAEADGELVGLARIWREDRRDGKKVYGQSVELVPGWHGKGIREGLFRYNEEHVRSISSKDSEGGPVFLELWTNDPPNDWKSIVEGRGYTPVQHELDMMRSLDEIPDIPLPEGLEIRPVRPEQYDVVREVSREAWKDVWDSSKDDWNEEYFEAYMKKSIFRPELWQVAWKGNTLAGMVLNYIVDKENRELGTRRGHTEYVFVREEFRGMGLARALLARSFKVLKDQGMEEAMLSVLVENPHKALRVYEGIGYRTVKHFTWFQKPIA